MSTDYTMMCVVRVDDTVGCSGQYAYLESATGVRDVSVGWGGMCVLFHDRNVQCESSPAYGEIGGRSSGDALDVSNGHYHRCILLASRNVDCGGTAATDGQAADWNGGNAIAVAVGDRHTCVLRSTGNVDCYGYNGDGRATDYNGGDAAAIDAGDETTCIVRTNGNVLCHGIDNGTAPASYLGGDAVAVGVGRHGLACFLLSSGNVQCAGEGYFDVFGTILPPYLGGDAVSIEVGLTHYCVLTRAGNALCMGSDLFGGGLAMSVWADPTIDEGPEGMAVCDDWNGDGGCNGDESLIVGPSEVVVSAPTGASLGPDGDGDGVAEEVALESGRVIVDLAQQEVRTEPTSSTSVPLDPDDSDGDHPARVPGASAGADVGCAADEICIEIELSAGLAGEDLTQRVDESAALGTPSGAVADATGHRPYAIQGDDLHVHGTPESVDHSSDPVGTDVAVESVEIGGSHASFGCDGPGSVATPTLVFAGLVATTLPGQSRAEPGTATAARCLAMEALAEDIVIPLTDVSV